jgi:paraquat-inducible protein A
MDTMIACHECDLIHRIQPLAEGTVARCTRCGASLYRHRRNSLERTLALTIAGMILFVLANSFPFLAMKIDTQVQQSTLLTGIKELYAQGMWEIALLVLLTTVLLPFIQLSSMLYVLLPIKFNRKTWMMVPIFRLLQKIQPWSMMEVFMLGILVSIVKLAGMAKMIPGASLFAFLALIFVLAASSATLDPHLVWERVEVKR